MKISWNETEQIEQYIYRNSDQGSSLLFEARMLLDAELQDKVLWQKKTYNVVQQYGRSQLRKEIEAVHQKLFTAPEHTGFSQKIRRLFFNK